MAGGHCYIPSMNYRSDSELSARLRCAASRVDESSTSVRRAEKTRHWRSAGIATTILEMITAALDGWAPRTIKHLERLIGWRYERKRCNAPQTVTAESVPLLNMAINSVKTESARGNHNARADDNFTTYRKKPR